MRTGWAPLLALTLAGCEKAEIGACETFVKEGLRSPGSYRRAAADLASHDMSLADFRKVTGDKPGGALEELAAQSKRRGIRTVTLHYDAQNAFGATVRETSQCLFRTEDGELSGDADETVAAVMAGSKSERDFRELLRSGAGARVSPGDVPPDPARACCL